MRQWCLGYDLLSRQIYRVFYGYNSTMVHIRQHPIYDRTVWRRIGLGVLGVVLIVLCFVAPLWIHDWYGWTISSRSNRLNAWVLLFIIITYVYAAIIHNMKILLTIDDRGIVYREWEERIDSSTFDAYSFTHHGKMREYYTLWLLDESNHVKKLIAFDDEHENILRFMHSIEQRLPQVEYPNFHWYEKVQRRLKV